MQELLGMLGLGGGGLLTKQAYDKLGNIGDDAMGQTRDIANEAIGQGQFTGYGVTGPVGSAQVDESGSLNMNLSPGQQQYADMAGIGSAGMMQRTMQDSTGRETDIYNKIRAMQQPGEQRQQMQLNNQLVNQGRAGVRSNLYGGTPEQLAMSKAQAEARNSAAFQAIAEGRAQQGQEANIANMFGDMQYKPMEQLRQDATLGNQAYQYKDVGNRQNQNIMAEALMGGLDTRLASGLGQANLMGELGSSLIEGGAGMFSSMVNSGTSSTISDFAGNIYDQIFG